MRTSGFFLMAFTLILAPVVGAEVNDDVIEDPPVLEGFKLRHNIGDDNLPKDSVSIEAEGWRPATYHDSGEITVDKGVVTLAKGYDMTGIRWTGPLPRMNYEIILEAKRIDGSDFFCGLTFPYGDSPCSFIVGGWGGGVIGISNVDYQDAYNNETCQFKRFEDDRWYTIRVRVTPNWIQAWIDDEQMVKLKTRGRNIDIRYEMMPVRPLGIATWRTAGAIRNVSVHAYTKPPEEEEYGDDADW